MRRSSALPTLTALLLALIVAGSAESQCLLANPSFELSGSGASFAGWNQFGPVGSSTVASHGQRAARVTGPATGNWDVAGFWQPLDTSPGARWIASVRARPTSAGPLTGGARAILNLEWRDAAGVLLSYESHNVASPTTPVDQWTDFSVQSGPAPAGTAKVRLLLGVLQGPTDPTPTVLFDEATLYPAGPPTLDDLQWDDFAGGRTVTFSGRTWRVKGPGFFGPGPNLFCNTPGCVWVDAGERLHLTLQNIGGQWYSSEVALEEALGYGDYIFTTVGRLDQLDPQAVFGLFIWQYGPCFDPGLLWWNPFNEIDVEFSRWGNPGSAIAQFVAQPFDFPGNITRFDPAFASDEISSHAFRWRKDRVEFRSWRGGPGDEAPGTMLEEWTYTGPHIPRPEQPRAHVNLWRFSGAPAAPQEVVLDRFTFVPEGSVVDIASPLGRPVVARMLAPPTPNPFQRSTHIRLVLPTETDVDLAIFDVGGRRVRSLERGRFLAGPLDVKWDGADESGEPLQAGVYLVRLTTESATETGRIVLIK